MHKPRQLFFSALILTCVNLLLRFIGTGFQIFLSNRIGASGIGLLQLVMSVGSLCMIAGIAGIRTAAMYLTAEEIGKKKTENIPRILSACFIYSIICSSTVAILLYIFAPWISIHWINDIRTEASLKLYAAFLPAACLCSVMTGLFTASNRIHTLAAVEVAEQLVSMVITMSALTFWAGKDPSKACQSVILGSCLGSLLTLGCLSLLQLRETTSPGLPIKVRKRLLSAAVPLACADVLKSGINTVENLMVPKRLQLNPNVADPLAAFGIVSGMVFPIVMFPACILFGLAELLIPELARCYAAGSWNRISYLVRRGLKVALLYGFTFGGLIFILSEDLCLTFYGSTEASFYLRCYALLVPILYCDALVDAMTKGLGQQTACVRYNIFTSAMDVILLYLFLPTYGMAGYFLSFAITHVINFILSLRRLFKITGERIPLTFPIYSLCAAIPAVYLSGIISGIPGKILGYTASFYSLLVLFQVLEKEDLEWVMGLCSHKKTVLSDSFV